VTAVTTRFATINCDFGAICQSCAVCIIYLMANAAAVEMSTEMEIVFAVVVFVYKW
jgi:hypothetical protein